MKYCVWCERNVRPLKYFSWGWFLFWCLTMLGGIVYVACYLFKAKECPICRGRDLGSPRLRHVKIHDCLEEMS